MFDYLKVHHDELLALCAPGEQPLAMAAVMYIAGHEEVGAMPPSDGVSFDPIVGLQVDSWERGVEKLVGGHTLYAPRGGLAVQLKQVTDSNVEMLLTDRRLIVIHGSLGSDGMARVAWACSVDDVAGLRRTPRPLQAGRISLVFRDGSSIRLMGGILFAKRPRALVDAFHRLTGR